MKTGSKSVTTGGGINISKAASIVNFLGDIHGAILASNIGTVNFGNGTQTNITVDGDNVGNNGIGGAGRLGNVNLNLGNGILTLSTGTINTDSLVFRSDDTLTIDARVVGNVSLGAVTTIADNTGTINFNAPIIYTSNGNIGAPNGGNLKSLNFGPNTQFNVRDGDNIYAPISGTGVTINAAGTSNFTTIGSKIDPIAFFTTAVGGTVTLDNLYAGPINNSGTINLRSGGVLSATFGNGTINLTDDATIGNISDAGNRTQSVIINKVHGGIITFEGDTIGADEFTQHGNVLKLTQDTIVTGNNYNIAGESVFDMADKKLTLNTALNMNNNLTLKAAVSGDTQNILTVNAPPILGNGTILTLSLESLGAALQSKTINLFGTAGNAVTIAQTATGVNITSAQVVFDNVNNDFVTAIYVDAAAINGPDGEILTEGTIVINQVHDQHIQDVLPDPPDTSSDDPGDSNDNVPDYIDDIIDTTNMTSEEYQSAVEDLDNKSMDIDNVVILASVTATTISGAISFAISSAVDTRLSPITIGKAAGSEDNKYGVWTQVLTGIGKQKKDNNLSGFDAITNGILVGADTIINDNTTIGMLGSVIYNNIKFKNISAGDKSNTRSFILGLYSSYDIKDTNFFVQGNLIVAKTSIHSKDKRLVAGGPLYQTAKGHYNILSFGSEIIGGYKYKLDNSYLVPTIGLRYNHFIPSSYTSSGLTSGNQTIKTEAKGMIYSLVGTRIGTNIAKGSKTITSEAHFNLSYILNHPSLNHNQLKLVG